MVRQSTPSEPLDIDALGEQTIVDYRGLVKAQVAGNAIDPKQLRDALVLTGKSLETFRTDVARLTERLAAAAAIALAECVSPRIAELRKVAAEAREKSLCIAEENKRRQAELTDAIQAAEGELFSLENEQRRATAEAAETLQKTADRGIESRIKRFLAESKDALIRTLQTHGPALSEKQEQRARAEAEGSDAKPKPPGPGIVAHAAAEARREKAIAEVQVLEQQAMDPVAGMGWSE